MIIGDQKVNDKFYSVSNNNLGKTQHTVAMEENLENYDFGLKDVNGKIQQEKTGSVIKSNKCNQCDYDALQDWGSESLQRRKQNSDGL